MRVLCSHVSIVLLFAAASNAAIGPKGIVQSDVAPSTSASTSFQSCGGFFKTTKICTVPDIGMTKDSGPNIRDAFTKCQSGGKIVLKGKYLVSTLIVTPKLQNVEIELSGSITYSDDIKYWSQRSTKPTGPGSYFLTYQNATTFFYIQGQNIYLHGGPDSERPDASKPGGGSTIDGQGQLWWDAFKKSENGKGGDSLPDNFARPLLLTIGDAVNVCVENLALRQGPFWASLLYQSKNVVMQGISVYAVSKSEYIAANSDGIDIYRTDQVILDSWDVNNSDDCISFKPNATNIRVRNFGCKGSHGISVGSLGQYKGEYDIVENVHVSDVKMKDCTYSMRIKLWAGYTGPAVDAGGGTGRVTNITFERVENTNVDMAIFLTSCYSRKADYCEKNPSNFAVSDIHYIDNTGTTSGKYKNVVATIDCSKTCTAITASGTELKPPGGDQPEYTCRNVDSIDALDFKCSPIEDDKKS